MHSNEALLTKLYAGFQSKDYKSMQACYANAATFHDPVFPNLNAAEVKAMWEMFCVTGKDLRIEFENIRANDETGSAEWTAHYTFSASGKSVVNRIRSSFEFSNGLITKHTDRFSFYKWASQALGLTGLLLGGTPLLKNKVQKTAAHNLANFLHKSLIEQ